MKKLWNLMKREDGASQMIEAVIIYPVVFMCLFFLIYVGLFILQSVTVSTYAQKIAMLASREISYPGYLAMVTNKDVYSDASVEGSDQLLGSLKLNNNPHKGNGQTYRYWALNLGADEDGFAKTSMMPDETYKAYETILLDMIVDNSLMSAKSRDSIKVDIKTKNNFIVQYVKVEVSQPLMGFPVLDYFGIETPTVKASAQTTVGDTDELVRNVDFVTDALAAFANKIGLDVAGMKQKVNEVKEMFGLQ